MPFRPASTATAICPHTFRALRNMSGMRSIPSMRPSPALGTPSVARAGASVITLAEGTGRIPRGTHDWSKFLTPDELSALMTEAGLTVRDVRGLSYSPTKGFMVSDSTALDYFVTATR